MCVSQRSVGVRRTWRAWTAETRLLRTCCSQRLSAPSLMRREAQITCLNSPTTTVTPRTWGEISVWFLCIHRVGVLFFSNALSGLYFSFLSTVSQFWYADSALATRPMSASCSSLQHPATGFLVCQLQLLCRLHSQKRRQSGAPKRQGSSLQPPPSSPQVMVSVTT